MFSHSCLHVRSSLVSVFYVPFCLQSVVSPCRVSPSASVKFMCLSLCLSVAVLLPYCSRGSVCFVSRQQVGLCFMTDQFGLLPFVFVYLDYILIQQQLKKTAYFNSFYY